MTTLLRVVFIGFLVSAFGVAVADPPPASGIVSRGEFGYGFWEVDTASGMGATLGGDIIEYCSDPEFDDWSLISYADKNLQNGFRLNAFARGELTASVWPFTIFDCDLFLTVQPLATGMAKLVDRDNDLFGWEYCDEKNNMNSFSRHAQGTLYTPSGAKRQFSMYTQGLFDCDTLSFEARTKIKLTD